MLYNLYFHILIIIIPLNFFLFSDEINNEKSDSLVKKDTLNDSLTYIDVTFSQLLSESKLLFADAVLADMNHDTLNALYYFDNLFESLAQLQKMNSDAPSFVKRK